MKKKEENSFHIKNFFSTNLEFFYSEGDGDEGCGQETTVLSETGEEGGGVWAGLGVGTHTLYVVGHQRLGHLMDGGRRRES